MTDKFDDHNCKQNEVIDRSEIAGYSWSTRNHYRCTICGNTRVSNPNFEPQTLQQMNRSPGDYLPIPYRRLERI